MKYFESPNLAADSFLLETVSYRSTLPEELFRPYDAQAILRQDLIPPASTLFEASDHDLGTGTIDVERYISREFFDLEAKKLWPKVWQFAAWTHDMSRAGDSVVYRIGDRSVVLVRQVDGSVKAFINSCLHRGRELCNTNARRNQLRCPYHGFTWTLEGALSWIPSQWDFPQVSKDKFALPQVRVEEWNGFIFINFDPDAPSLESYMGAMQAQWKTGGDTWDFTTKYKAVHVEKLINCNWKICMEAFIEALHVFASHPQITDMVPESSTQYDVWADQPHFSRFHNTAGLPSSTLRKQPTQQAVVDSFTRAYLPEIHQSEFSKLREGETARQAFARLSRKAYKDRMGVDVSSFPDAELIDGTEYFLFPNFMPWPSLGNPIVYRFRPGESADWCIWETMLFLPFAGERPPSGSIIKVGPDESLADVKELGYLDLVLQQDAAQLPHVQRGLKASATRVVNLARYQEARIRHYNQTLDSYLAR
jgi:phenylpropionate dioxygenase-like ring-hydroxylating dioxygenase large terminal subunit